MMTLLIRNLSDGFRSWMDFIQLPLQRCADKPTRGVSLLFEGIELLLQFDGKLNNNANQFGHDRDSLWAK